MLKREKERENKTKIKFNFIVSSSEGTNQPVKGRLSSRMLIPGNTWQTVWIAAKPVPARRQVFLLIYFFFSFTQIVSCVEHTEFKYFYFL